MVHTPMLINCACIDYVTVRKRSQLTRASWKGGGCALAMTSIYALTVAKGFLPPDIDAIEAPDEMRPAYAYERLRTGGGRQDVAEFLAGVEAEEASFTHEEERAVVAKIDKRVLALVLGAYFYQQLDKSTLSYVSIFGITEDAHLVGQQFSWLGSILYVAQLLMQPIAALILVRLPTGKVLGGAILLWGLSLCFMSACTNFRSLLAMRFALGTFESVIAPCCVAITQMWWRRSEQTMRTSYWNAMNGVTSVLGSLITYGLGNIKTQSMYRYQAIFLFCGVMTVLYSFIVLALMPDSPMEAKYLRKRERLIAVERLRANQMGISTRNWRWDHFRETLLDVKTYLWFMSIITISIASGGIGTFGSLIVKSFGFDSFTTILFNIPFGLIQLSSIVASGWAATRYQRKGTVIAIMSLPPSIGTLIMLTVPRERKGTLLFGYYLVSTMACITPLLVAWQSQNTAGDTKKKCTSGLFFVGLCAGNIIGPLLFSVEDAPLYRKGLSADLFMFICVGLSGLIIPSYLQHLNQKHEKRRVELGKSRRINDESMTRKGDSEENGAGLLENTSARLANVENDNGLQDMTDLQNEDFIYTY